MKYVEVIADTGSVQTLSSLAEKMQVKDFRASPPHEDGKVQIRMLVEESELQRVLDALQNLLGAQPYASIIVMPVEACLPKSEKEESTKNKKKKEASAAASRESLYQEVEKGARLDSTYLLLVVLATIVAAIGLIEDNVAVVIGAMVIAPLLGPNLSLSLATALGDGDLMWKSIKTFMVGIAIALGMSVAIGFMWSGDIYSQEIMARTTASLDSIALALASGAAATLSLTTGLSSVLVGVMVAVALLPPTVALGTMLGAGNLSLAGGAGLLLAINIVCVNLASKLVFFYKGIRPRTWFEKEKAKRAMIRYVLGWAVTLAVLLVLIYTKR